MPSIDKEKARKNIALILDKIRTDTDPRLLNEYRRLFKKEVSLFRRSWVAAYLLMLQQGGGAGRAADRSRPRKNGPESRPKDDGYRAEPRQYPLSEEESKRLFISIGRNRRVFPREILGLINAKTATPKEDIGAIRIMDNYSFVQVRDTVAETIIDALNGLNFRGRTLVVNYAKARKDGETENQESREEAEEIEETSEETFIGETPIIEESDDSDGVDETDSEMSEQGQDHPEEEDIERDSGQ